MPDSISRPPTVATARNEAVLSAEGGVTSKFISCCSPTTGTLNACERGSAFQPAGKIETQLSGGVRDVRLHRYLHFSRSCRGEEGYGIGKIHGHRRHHYQRPDTLSFSSPGVPEVHRTDHFHRCARNRKPDAQLHNGRRIGQAHQALVIYRVYAGRRWLHQPIRL